MPEDNFKEKFTVLKEGAILNIEKETMDSTYEFNSGNTPIIAVAIHDGHEIRQEVVQALEIDESGRLTEEDPFTGKWTKISNNSIVVKMSRFEVDINRVREKAVYIQPEDAWGLKVWKTNPGSEIIKRSLAKYDSFYSSVHKIFTDLQSRFKKFVVFDLHSYNHRHNGPNAKPNDPALNPEKVRAEELSVEQWERIINRFIHDLANYNYLGRKLDVRENIKFRGGHFAKWTHQNFPESACVLSIEFKKFFMDEWSGKPDNKQIQAIADALKFTVSGVLVELQKL